MNTKNTVRCPNCEWRIFDEITPTTGIIEVKCPNCRKVVSVDLTLKRKADVNLLLAEYV